jgi:hypothetical protein
MLNNLDQTKDNKLKKIQNKKINKTKSRTAFLCQLATKHLSKNENNRIYLTKNNIKGNATKKLDTTNISFRMV